MNHHIAFDWLVLFHPRPQDIPGPMQSPLWGASAHPGFSIFPRYFSRLLSWISFFLGSFGHSSIPLITYWRRSFLFTRTTSLKSSNKPLIGRPDFINSLITASTETCMCFALASANSRPSSSATRAINSSDRERRTAKGVR